MQSPIDPELVTAGVYLLIVPLYGLLWRGHTRQPYAGLTLAALILAVCAFIRSETVLVWDARWTKQDQLLPTNHRCSEERYLDIPMELPLSAISIKEDPPGTRVEVFVRASDPCCPSSN